MSGGPSSVSPFLEMSRAEWAKLRAGTPMTLDESDLDTLSGINEELSLAEVEEVYLPLSRLLSMYVRAVQELHETTAAFLGTTTPKVPFVIGIAGSVAVGKSTTARVLQALLSRWPSHPEVALVTTDGFLLDNQELTRRGLMDRKGFPESYDRAALLRFVSAVKSGEPEVRAPVYSHLTYDIVLDEHIVVRRPDVLIVEGLNVLQTGADGPRDDRPFVSDFFDFSVYVDADLADIRAWYVERFLTLRTTAFRDPASYFRTYADLGEREARATALRIWTEINEVNLIENIEPTRSRATLILEKGSRHRVRAVRLRKL